MSAQCRHGLIRYECWKCRDEANQSTHVAHVFAGGLVTAVQQLEAKDAEIARLRQDLAAARARVAELEGERDIWNKECDRREDDRIKAEQRTDFARQRAERAEAELAAALELRQKGCDCNDDDACRFARERDAALADLAAARADAARYRWIRDNHEVRGRAMEIVYGMNGSDWDAAIDAALAGEKK